MYWNGILANARLNELETKSSYLTRYNDKRDHGTSSGNLFVNSLTWKELLATITGERDLCFDDTMWKNEHSLAWSKHTFI